MKLGGRAAVGLTALAIMVAAPHVAHADDAERARELAARGIELARQGRASNDAGKFGEAIELFKQAFALDPQAEYQCSIGIAYRDRGDLPRAHLFLGRCIARTGAASRERRTALRKVHGAIESALRESGHIPVDVVVEPVGAAVSVAGFAADEVVPAPAQVWLPPGSHTITATAPGFERASSTVQVEAGKRLARVRLVLEEVRAAEPAPVDTGAAVAAEPAGPGLEPKPPPTDRSERRRDRLGLILGVGGGVTIATGGLFHALAWSNIQDAEGLHGAPYDDAVSTIRWQRAAAIGLYGVGGVAAAVGIYRLFRDRGESRVSVSTAPTDGGAAVWVTWRR